MAIDNEELHDAVDKIENSDDSTEVEKAEEIVNAKADEIEQEEKLEEKVQERLDALGEEKSTPDEEDSETADEEKDSDDSTPGNDDQADEKDEGSDSTPDEDDSKTADDENPDKKPADEKDSTPEIKGIPDAYYRAAKHNEWTDEQIKNLYGKDPELCLNTLKVLHENDNRLTREFAALGRARAKPKSVIAAEPVKKDEPEVEEIDIKKLQEEYGDDLIVKVVEGLQKQIKNLINVKSKEQPTIDPEKLEARSKEIKIIQKEIDGFFSADGLKNYNEFYGEVPKEKDWHSLTGEQHDNRWRVLQMADEILTGALSLGQELTVDEAMNRAHAVVSAPVLERIIREDLKGKIVKRSKGLSLKPSSGKPAAKGKPMTESDMETTTQRRLDKVFKKY